MASNVTILIVDDFQIVRKTVKHHLRAMGFDNSLEAADGLAALEVVQSRRIDLIIADWNMPHMSGLDFLREVRADDKSRNIPFIMLTAEATEDAVIKAAQSGATDYMVKPFTQQTLAKKITNVLGNAVVRKR